MPDENNDNMNSVCDAASDDGDSGGTRPASELASSLYSEMRRMAARCLGRRPSSARVERDDVIRPTALVHECYLRIARAQESNIRGRSHFLALSARVMRQVLIDEQRRRGAVKRGAGMHRITLSGLYREDTTVDLVALNDALETLESLHPRQCRVVEYRAFSGMTFDEIASELGIGEKTARLDWRMARSWLSDRLRRDDDAMHESDD